MHSIYRFIIVAGMLFLFTGIWCFSAIAMVPKTMSYQGYLTDAARTPVSGNCSMTFRFYNVVDGGSPLWSETQPAVELVKGIYQVTLGSLSPLNAPFDQPYYLGVAVGDEAEMTPRRLLTSVGTSLRAAIADSVADGGVTTAALAPTAQADLDNRYAPASFSQATTSQIAMLRWDQAKPGATFAVGSYPRSPAFDGTNIWVPNYGIIPSVKFGPVTAFIMAPTLPATPRPPWLLTGRISG